MEGANKIAWQINARKAKQLFSKEVREALWIFRVDAVVALAMFLAVISISVWKEISISETVDQLNTIFLNSAPVAIVMLIILVPLFIYTLTGIAFLIAGVGNIIFPRSDRSYVMDEIGVTVSLGTNKRSYAWDEFNSFCLEGTAFFLHKKTAHPNIFVVLYTNKEEENMVCQFLNKKLEDDKGKYYFPKFGITHYPWGKYEFA